MRTLTVNGSTVEVPGLGACGTYPNLSEKRITKAVREQLRKQHGRDKVKVSCDAEQHGNTWQGQCWIESVEHTWNFQ